VPLRAQPGKVQRVVNSVSAALALVCIWISCKGDISVILLPPDAIASGWRAVDAEASVLQPQDWQTLGPALSESMSPQHIGQVLPYRVMFSLVLQNSNRASIYRTTRLLCCVRLVTVSPAAEGPDVIANRTAISSNAATAYTIMAMGDAYSRLPVSATIP
jgi:hypothetical protein